MGRPFIEDIKRAIVERSGQERQAFALTLRKSGFSNRDDSSFVTVVKWTKPL